MKNVRGASIARLAVVMIAAALLGVASAPTAPAAGDAHASHPAADPDPGSRPELAIYAAASLRDVLTELTPSLESAAGARVVFNFAGSNDLARQILAADKADIFISADEGWMDKVAEAGLADKGTRRVLLSNRLVVVVPEGSGLAIGSAEDLAKPQVARIALADPEAVPAGKYAKAWLTKKGQWTDALRTKVLATADVRAALAAVASGNVDAGVVYQTDAAISKKVRVAYVVPADEGPKITYPIAVMAHSAHATEARRAATYLSGKDARAIFERFGFLPFHQENP